MSNKAAILARQLAKATRKPYHDMTFEEVSLRAIRLEVEKGKLCGLLELMKDSVAHLTPGNVTHHATSIRTAINMALQGLEPAPEEGNG